jgi:hypothetical protein
MNKKPKQADRVLSYMSNYGSITALQAMRDLGVYRLASRIHELREHGFGITSDSVLVQNRYGDKSRIARYTLNEHNER